MSRKNITFLTKSYHPNIGGVERHAKNIVQVFLKKNYNLTIITENEKNKFEDYENHGKLKIYRIPVKKHFGKFKKYFIWAWLMSNKNIIKNSDVVHAHDVGYWYLPFKFLYPRKKFYITFHGYEPGKENEIKFKLAKKIDNSLCDGNIVIGKYLEEWLNIKADYISYGASSFYKTKTKGFTKKFGACFVGRLMYDTGISKYLKVVKNLTKKGNNFSVVICGDGPLKRKLIEFTNKNNLNVIFKGFVKNPSFYLQSSKIAFCSQYLSIIEALQAEIPVFALYDKKIEKAYLTALPISRNIIIDHSAKELSQKILNYFQNKTKYLDQFKPAYKWAKKQTWQKIAQKYESLWDHEN